MTAVQKLADDIGYVSFLHVLQVVLDESGFSKGYGFVRFGSESEQQHALANMTGESGVGSKPIKVSMANQKSRASVGGAAPAQVSGLDMSGRPIKMETHPNGSSTSWGSLDGPMGNPGGAGGNPSGARAGNETGWPGVQSAQPTAAWNQPAAATHIAAAAATHPDFSTYQHYYSQYAQQFSQQQQQYAAAWSAWQQQQP